MAIGARRSNNLKALNKYFRYGFIENLDTVRHIPLGKFWGIKLSATPITWLSPIVFCLLLGVVLNMRMPGKSRVKTFYHAEIFVIGVMRGKQKSRNRKSL